MQKYVRNIEPAMIKKAGGKSEVIDTPDDLVLAEKLILPGVGHFKNAMDILNSMGYREVLDRKVLFEHVPILCICLGAQLVTRYSEEGDCAGLGWIDANVKRFNFQNNEKKIRVPHMGWNLVNIKKESALFKGMYDSPVFYFVHSYYIEAEHEKDILTTTLYGDIFVSSLEKNNIFATQFHPEKSHKYGMKLIQNFIEI